MKRICLIFLIAFASCRSAQKKDHTIVMDGLGSLKLGMSQTELEKLLNKKIEMTKNYLDTLNGSYQDTAKLKYEDIDVQLEFDRSYTGADTFHMRLIGIRASSPLCKTAAGIGVGSDKASLLTEYDGYHINIQPGYVSYYSTEEGKGKSTMSIMDDAESFSDTTNAYTTVFYLLNKKVVSFELKAKLKEER